MALLLFRCVTEHDPPMNPADVPRCAAAAVRGFLKAIGLGISPVVQEALRLMKLWFAYGHLDPVPRCAMHMSCPYVI